MTGDPDAITSGGTGTKREARERAVELAYEARIRDLTIDELFAVLPNEPNRIVTTMLRAVEEHSEEVDRLIAERSLGWSIDRMPAMDLLIMRLAVAEMLSEKTPTAVVLSESVIMAGRYSTDDSSRFVNGVLAAIAELLDR